ncbi:hypothetical protein KO519_18305 [Paraglaciecola agarilytica]|uniref:hypothetical protein n=1 Tax=Paraglaciecola chathamensis TaxID=368405 RepID=UPI001C085BE4|nr:hypothetical protein [Paraglaciecola agarilytica]MBU3019630.1 hypothetical protein [Paraglaciecola agarilytica]
MVLGITTQVQRGENINKALAECFIVLEHQQVDYRDTSVVQLNWLKTNIDARGFAVVAWVTDDTLRPLQVVAAEVPRNWVKDLEK